MVLGAEWGFAIAAFWIMLMLVRGIRLLMHAIYLRRVWKRAKPASSEPAIHALLLRAPRAAELCTSEDVDSPSVIGFFSPRLLIPAWLFAELAPSELQHIVLHECEHLRRYDDWINLLQQIGLVLFPLNPALFWLNRRLGLERELACDDSVVASTEAPFDYARCLTRLAEHHLYRRSVALSLSAWGRQSELTRRVHTLVAPCRQIVSAAGTILSCPDLCRVNRWRCRDGSLPSFLLFHRRDHECSGRGPHGRGSNSGKSSRASSGLSSNRAGTPNPC